MKEEAITYIYCAASTLILIGGLLLVKTVKDKAQKDNFIFGLASLFFLWSLNVYYVALDIFFRGNEGAPWMLIPLFLATILVTLIYVIYTALQINNLYYRNFLFCAFVVGYIASYFVLVFKSAS
jgi:hypothetical protein